MLSQEDTMEKIIGGKKGLVTSKHIKEPDCGLRLKKALIHGTKKVINKERAGPHLTKSIFFEIKKISYKP